jgi:hypothetical protein
MKLWFERWNVNAYDALGFPANATPADIAARDSAINRLAVNRRRGDSAANEFRPKM